MIRRRHVLPSVSLAEISPEVAKLSRRRLLRNGLSLGSLALLTGCDLSTHSGVDAALWAMLRFNDRVQSVLYNPQRLAETYPASAITRPFRFNAYYPIWEVRPVPENWRLAVTGLVADKTPWTVDRLRGLPQQAQITRHICIEGWSQIGQWSGVPLHLFLRHVGADLRARYVAFTCFDGYSTSIDMDVDATCTTNWSQLAWSCPFRRQAFMHRHPTNSSTLHTSGNHRRAATGGSVDRPRGLVCN